jgi:hypothetical protein
MYSTYPEFIQNDIMNYKNTLKEKQSRYGPGVAQRVPGI